MPGITWRAGMDKAEMSAQDASFLDIMHVVLLRFGI